MQGKWRIYFCIVGLAVLVGISFWKTPSLAERRILLQTCPVGVMGTECSLIVYVNQSDKEYGEQLLSEAEKVLRECEILTSTWLENSEISRFNRMKAGQFLKISPFTEDFFLRSRKAWEETGGVFDITCGRIWQLWREAEKTGVLPDEEMIQVARNASGWGDIYLEPAVVTKTKDMVEVVSGGIAKGMAVDRAMKCLLHPKVLAAVVEVGGDLSVFQREGVLVPMEIRIRCPWEKAPGEKVDFQGMLTRQRVVGICTSGNYERYFHVGGKYYSQILDPRTGFPSDEFLSVTVVAPDAATADVWATALSILGEKGREILSEGVHILSMIKNKLPRNEKSKEEVTAGEERNFSGKGHAGLINLSYRHALNRSLCVLRC